MTRSFHLDLAAIVLPLAILAAGEARAAGPFSREAFSGVIVGGPVVASGEPSWFEGGLGKLQAGQGSNGLGGSAIVAWSGNVTDRIGLLVTADAQSLGRPIGGVDEAYVTLRPSSVGGLRMSGRAGLFFPPVSLEHDGSEWSVIRTLTPSAINSWIAEEVKVAGAEASLRGTVAGQDLGLTAAVFQANDTSGALMTFRGWALHDLRANLGGDFRLPPLPAMFVPQQGQTTRPVYEVDGRWGAYARADLSVSPTLSVNAFAYDNRGDKTSLVRGQYAWRTRFAQVAARWRPDARTEVLVQAMTGETAMGGAVDGLVPADVGFSAAYVLVSRSLSRGSASVRLDQFSVSDRTFKASDNNAEHGWSGTVALLIPFSARSELVLEGVGVRSRRPDRRRLGLAPSQTGAQGRLAIRTVF